MLLHRLRVRDFGPFAGEHEFVLTPGGPDAAGRTIVLFGGKNGSGKTSILSAVKLCLFGPGAIGERPASKSYQEYIQKAFHHGQQEAKPASSTMVALEFEQVVLGRRERYCVQREWTQEAGGLRDQVVVSRDGTELTDVDADQWQRFIEGLVPPGVADLFFFDGEAIQKLAGEGVVNGRLSRSVEALLGVSLVDRLQDDLAFYERHYLLRGIDRERRQEMASIERRLGQLSSRLGKRRLDASGTRREISRVDGQIEKEQDELARSGGLSPEETGRLRARRGELRSQVSALEDRARELCAGILPLALCPSLAHSLEDQLAYERSLLVGKYSREALKSIAPQLVSSLLDRLGYESGASDQGVDVGRLTEELLATAAQALPGPADEPDGSATHDLSDRDSEGVRAALAEARVTATLQAKEISCGLEAALDELEAVERRLSRAPEEAHLQDLLARLQQLRDERSGLERTLAQQEAEVTAAEAEIAELQRQQDRLLDSIRTEAALDRKRSLAQGLSMALQGYREELAQRKVNRLNEIAARTFGLLSRKRNRSIAVSLQGREFEVHALDARGRRLPHESLSAGERQVLAVAFLWALAEASSRQLPVIIDTPLARLDGDHRRNLVEHYFPKASHQMIILSTDAEVDRGLLLALQPLVARAYQLEYDEASGASTAVAGYFWEGRGAP